MTLENGDKNGEKGGEALDLLKEKMGEQDTQLKMLQAEKAALEQKLTAADDQLLSQEYMDFLASKRKSKEAGDKSEDKGEAKTVDFSSMSAEELVKHITTQQAEALTGVKTGIDENLNKLVAGIQSAFAGIDLKIACLTHGDLGEQLKDKGYKERFAKMAQDNPTWDAEKVYANLKATLKGEADAKAEAEAEKEAKELAAVSEKGGPTKSAFIKADMTADEAADLAYRASFGTKKGAEEE